MKFVPGPVHDPYVTPRVIPEASLLKTVLDRIMPRGTGKEHGVIAIRVSQPRNVLGAKPLAACSLCGEQLWVSPSTQTIIDAALFVCDVCVMEAMGMRR